MNLVHMKRLLALTTVIVTLHGCATLSEEECLYADWYQIGLEDGSLGKDSLTLAKHRKACAKAGITPDRAEYDRGHEQGLLRYCQYSTGLSLGERGSSMPLFCPEKVRTEFELGYQHGVERHQQNIIIGRIRSDIRQLHDAIHDHEDYIAHLEEVLTSEHTGAKQREEALDDMRTAEAELEILTSQLLDAQQTLDLEQDQLQRIISDQNYY